MALSLIIAQRLRDHLQALSSSQRQPTERRLQKLL
jgi:hypothetical protein